jgi:hypothetical protein
MSDRRGGMKNLNFKRLSGSAVPEEKISCCFRKYCYFRKNPKSRIFPLDTELLLSNRGEELFSFPIYEVIPVN